VPGDRRKQDAAHLFDCPWQQHLSLLNQISL
jgi:hypothetical protein